MLLPFLHGEDVVIAPPLKQFAPELAGAAKEVFRWWVTSNVSEFTLAIARGVLLRERGTQGGLVILDRSADMFKAVCVAKWMLLSEHPSMEVMFAMVDKMFAETGVHSAEHEVRLFLSRCTAYNEKTAPFREILRGLRSEANTFSEAENQAYAAYQAALSQTMRYLQTRVTHEEIVVSDSVLAVQNRIRTILNHHIGSSFPKLGSSIQRVVGLSGLSESGKSTRAEMLTKVSGGYRLKLKFFNFMDIRGDYSEEESIALKLLAFCHVHYYRGFFTIESLHGVRLAAFLKLFFGDLFELQFLDTPYNERVQRWARNQGVNLDTAMATLAERDREKELLGCSRIRDIADVVV